jgi:hypothetical protein
VLERFARQLALVGYRGAIDVLDPQDLGRSERQVRRGDIGIEARGTGS